MLDLEKAYFGIRVWDSNKKEFVDSNLFGSCRVLDSIAVWKLRKHVREKYIAPDDVISWCFGDVRGRVQYEMEIGGPFSDETVKTDIYSMYVLPNKKLLYDMLLNITIASCKRWAKKSTKLSR